MPSENTIYEMFLFNKLKDGDRSSFRFFFDAYYSDLCNYVNLFVRNESLSEEIVQDVFIYLWNNREKINIGKSVRAYLYTASKNKGLNHIRDEKVRARILSDLTDIGHDRVPQPDEIMEEKEYQHMFSGVIDQLPPRCREIFLLSRMHGYTNEQIATELKISHKTVENQMTIALRKMRERIVS
jgi:RNA polymerase sigma-70 factor (ECF subfamily)